MAAAVLPPSPFLHCFIPHGSLHPLRSDQLNFHLPNIEVEFRWGKVDELVNSTYNRHNRVSRKGQGYKEKGRKGGYDMKRKEKKKEN